MKRPRSYVLLITLFAGLVLGAGCASAPDTTASNSKANNDPAPASDWQKVVPGGDAVCSDGSEYAFYTRAGDPKKLMFFLQGGGGCWNTQTCDPLGRPSYTVNLDGFHPSQSDGVFNMSRTDNPVRDHTMVFVPYCTGDVHLGAATRSYQRSAKWLSALAKNGVDVETTESSFTVAHQGLANARAALRWVSAEVAAPESVLVAGSSAGSIPSPYYGVQLAQMYPNARISQLGDGSGGYRRMNQSASPQVAWGTVAALTTETAFADLNDSTFNFEQLYTLAQAAAPDLRLHAYDTAEDDVQLQFLRLSGLQVDSLEKAIRLNQADIRESAPAFASYIAAGELHTILRRPEFYLYEENGRSVRDWLADIVAGRTVNSVSCTSCTTR